MLRTSGLRPVSGSTFAFWLLAALFAVLWLAGGASRADAPGQPAVRLAAWGILLALVFVAPAPQLSRPGPVAALLGAAVVLVVLQLLPLPPTIWTSLPGRELLLEAARAIGEPQPWRPLSISPAATGNALGALVVPVATFLVARQLDLGRQRQLITLLLTLIIGGAVVGLLQFTGAGIDNPFLNDIPGSVSGNFANRNHFAMFMAIGCLLLPMWAFRDHPARIWKIGASAGLIPFLLLVILATGSRMGLLLTIVGLVLGLLIVRREAGAALKRLPRRARLILPVVLGAVVLAAIAASVLLDRAAAVDRALTLQSGADLRVAALPVIWGLVTQYFPVGAGFGTFDPVYRIVEPDALLQTTYLNHAHNDWLEIPLEGGLPAIALLLTAVLWWVVSSVRIWRSESRGRMLAKAGSAIIFLVLLASITDYPARTPMIMAILVVAAVWMTGPSPSSSGAEKVALADGDKRASRSSALRDGKLRL